MGSKGHFFFLESSRLAYKINGNEAENTIALIYTHNPWVRSKGPFFLKSVMLQIKLKERSVEHYASKMFDHVHTSDLLDWVKRS